MAADFSKISNQIAKKERKEAGQAINLKTISPEINFFQLDPNFPKLYNLPKIALAAAAEYPSLGARGRHFSCKPLH